MKPIEFRELTRVHGSRAIVDHLTCTVRPGRVTGFLGPNGAGKSTTLRMLSGLTRPTSGTATIGGRRHVDQPDPIRRMGVLLDPQAAHPGRRARDHLRVLAASHRLPRARVDAVLELAGLESAARDRVGTFSLGMRQRLGVAAALLGDPEVLVLDEPTNGLDPEGIVWIRELMRSLTREGRTVLVSSHLMAESAAFVDHVIVLGRGRLLADSSLPEFLDSHSTPRVRVRTSEPARLATAVTEAGFHMTRAASGSWVIEGMRARDLGDLAASVGAALSELSDERASLEEAYLTLTAEHAAFASRARSTTDA
ncbi:ABC transporter ATP-binding protein (plasmid) [Streptomyces sp. BI20]|uniref:ABC transporter ATP-binding protein n=1 Tax=Streptomyces sp. BI20 TaxID=3403460 RepID=UPI003C743C01